MSTAMLPSMSNVDCHSGLRTNTEISPVFGSYHTSVVQFGFCDGSVRGLPRTIDSNILALLASINDGQAIPGGY